MPNKQEYLHQSNHPENRPVIGSAAFEYDLNHDLESLDIPSPAGKRYYSLVPRGLRPVRGTEEMDRIEKRLGW